MCIAFFILNAPHVPGEAKRPSLRNMVNGVFHRISLEASGRAQEFETTCRTGSKLKTKVSPNAKVSKEDMQELGRRQAAWRTTESSVDVCEVKAVETDSDPRTADLALPPECDCSQCFSNPIHSNWH